MRDVTSRRSPDRPVNLDEPVDEDRRNRWVKYLSEMVSLVRIRFRRCTQPPGVSDQPILIIFTDASSQAYGACAYARWTLPSKRGETCLISAKNRIEPNRQISIPRLELCGAVLGCRLAEPLVREMTYKFREVLYIVDSIIVRSQIQKRSYGFGTFVATRIAEIQSKSNPNQWWWMGGSSSPADMTSR